MGGLGVLGLRGARRLIKNLFGKLSLPFRNLSGDQVSITCININIDIKQTIIFTFRLAWCRSSLRWMIFELILSTTIAVRYNIMLYVI